jgi:pimeloyl-ACP methyl ester carboxylesterase
MAGSQIGTTGLWWLTAPPPLLSPSQSLSPPLKTSHWRKDFPLRRLLGAVSGALLLLALLPALGGMAAHAGTGNYPIVLIPGWHGSATTFDEMIPKLQAQGFTVLDFDPNTPGVQAMGYAPTAAGQHISYVAGKIVQQKIKTALQQNGYDPNTQKVDIVAHSMGGLVARFLIEHPGADVDNWSSTTGWYGDGVADVDTNWASRVDDLVMLGTPNHGTWEGWVPGTIGGFGNWNTTGGDMAPNSKFLQLMGTTEPVGQHYTTIGGDPTYLQFFKYDYNGDGISHGFDGVVPAESPFMTGSVQSLVNNHHGELVTADAPIDLTIQALGFTSSQTGIGAANLAGTATIRLEYADIVQDHDFGTTDEFRFDVYVDPDGGNDGYTYLNTINYDRDAPFAQSWGNTGPSSVAINVPGTSPRMDVKLDVWESDPGGAREAVSTVFFTNVMLSDDLDGQDYYTATAPDSKGGTNTFRISMNGATSAVGQTRLVTFGFDKAYIKDVLEPFGTGNAEAEFTLHAGRDGYAGTFYRGTPSDSSWYSRSANTYADIGVDAKNNGVVESETIWKGRMLKGTTWRFDGEYFDDDGGWSSRDSGGQYYATGSVDTLPVGRQNWSGTGLSAWNIYFYVVTAQ